MFGPKLALARAAGALSRRSGRGGGTTLPGRLLLRMAPDAISRLGARLQGGSVIVSATNGKTTTAGMIAAALRAAGRVPVHNRAGSNMTWGVATALLEQRGEEGLFEVDEAWLPRVAAELEPAPDRARQPVPRPARPLRGAGASRRRVGGAGRGSRRPDRVRAQRRRPADRRPRPRPRPGPAPRRHLLRDRRSQPGAAGAPARLRRQALPPLRRALRLRAGLRRAPRPLLVPALRRRPPAGRTSPRPGSSWRECAARASRCGRPRARSSCAFPSPASTTSTTRSPR